MDEYFNISVQLIKNPLLHFHVWSIVRYRRRYRMEQSRANRRKNRFFTDETFLPGDPGRSMGFRLRDANGCVRIFHSSPRKYAHRKRRRLLGVAVKGWQSKGIFNDAWRY